MAKKIVISSLLGEEIIDKQEKQAAVLEKLASPKKVSKRKATKSDDLTLEEQMQHIISEVYRILGRYAENTIVITTREQLKGYIDEAIAQGVIAIDTETNNSLDPITCQLMGPCLYTWGQKQAYVPLNHVDLHTGERLPDQLTEQDVAEELARLTGANTFVVTHNGGFDYRVLKCTTGWQMHINWDTLIGAKMLDSTEKAKLKEQYIRKIDSSIEKYDIEHLFEGLPYAIFPPEVFALYAATDAFMTLRLYDYQRQIYERPENARLLNAFLTVEVPVIVPTAEMELNGVCLDKEYAARLSVKYHKKLEEVQQRIAHEMQQLRPQIEAWRLTPEAQHCDVKKGKKQKSLSEKLKDPVELTSPTQLSILLYDVLKVPAVSKDDPRGTGEDVLAAIDLPLCKLITEQRGLLKLLGSFVDSLPLQCNPKTGRVHASFNQSGTETGRYSCSEPNLQQIPSHRKDVRLMFTASPGYVMVGSDFSAQEPRLLATYSQDHNMCQAYIDDKDLYAVVAQKVYNNNYEDNLQTHADGSPFPEGKARRQDCKSILLGIMYGRGVDSVAEQIHKTKDEAQDIIDKFYGEFPSVKTWVEGTVAGAHQNLYVEDLWGRRRNLPDIALPKYRVVASEGTTVAFNPLLGCDGESAWLARMAAKYLPQMEAAKNYREASAVKSQAKAEGVSIESNVGFINRAERQCVNARIQGGAASMSKRAIAAIYRDPEMNQLGFRLLLMVHDELIGECPQENAERCRERLSEIMSDAGKPEVTLPMKCDAVCFARWYLDEYSDSLCEKWDMKLAKGSTPQELWQWVLQEYCESEEWQLREILGKRLAAC